MYIRERYYFSVVCIFIKVIKNFEVNVNVQKGPLKFRESTNNRLLVLSNPHFHPLVSTLVIALSDNIGPFLLGLHLGSRFYKLEALGMLMDSLEFVLWIVAKLLCSCLCLFDASIKLHTMDEKKSNDFLLGSESGSYK